MQTPPPHIRPALFRFPLISTAVVAAITLAGYVNTMAPGLTWQHDGADGGDLIAAVQTLGIPHPPGYPTYVLLARAFTRLPLGGSLAYRTNLFSAVAATAAVIFIFLAARQVLRHVSASSSLRNDGIAAIAALALAFSPTLWSQSVITEVYALHAAFAGAILFCILRYEAGEGRTSFWPQMAALLFGIGLGNHLTLVFIAPAAVIYLAGTELRWKGWGRITLLAIAGLAIYAYLPWRARAWPPINWGNPQNVSGLWWMLSAAPYRHYAFSLPLRYLPTRLVAGATLWLQQFGPLGLACVLIGAWHLWQTRRRLAAALLLYFALNTAYAIGYNTTDSYVYLIPAYLVSALWLAVGLLWIGSKFIPTHRQRRGWDAALMALFLLALPGANWWQNHRALDLRTDVVAQTYAATTFRSVEHNALILADEDQHVFALWYYRYVEMPRTDDTVLAEGLLEFPWYRETLQRNGERIHWPGTATLTGFVQANLADRPIYVTTPHPELLTRFRLRRIIDGLYRVEPRN
ncbi:MAG: DUF2723 domain-containing protein [Chloroflexi bacterium]|nr:DUF2723 domain-containing protein [Chloroflexota bacterium]